MRTYYVTAEDLQSPYEDGSGYYGHSIKVLAETPAEALEEALPQVIKLMNEDNLDWSQEDKYTVTDELKITVMVEIASLSDDEEVEEMTREDVIEFLASRDCEDLGNEWVQGNTEPLYNVFVKGYRGFEDMSNVELAHHYREATDTVVVIVKKDKKAEA